MVGPLKKGYFQFVVQYGKFWGIQELNFNGVRFRYFECFDLRLKKQIGLLEERCSAFRTPP